MNYYFILLYLLTNLLQCSISGLKIKRSNIKQNHQFYSSFFGKVNYNNEFIGQQYNGYQEQIEYQQDEQQKPSQQQQQSSSQQSQQQSKQGLQIQQQNQAKILINGSAFVYKNPFILRCFNSDNQLIRKDQCSSKSRCLKLLFQYEKCQGYVNYQQKAIEK